MRHVLLTLLPVGVVCACSSAQSFDRSTEPGASAPPTTVEVKIIDADQLALIPGWTVLDAMRNRLPGVKIQDRSGLNGCPVVQLRGNDEIEGDSNPTVYVDGTRTSDTCTLIALPAVTASRVEIYPLGYTPRPGYAGNGHGLILIFLKRADIPDDSTMEQLPGR